MSGTQQHTKPAPYKAPENPTASNTVTVACKLPHGLTLRLFTGDTWDEPVMGGGTRKASRATERPGTRVTINGWNSTLGPAAGARLPVVAPYALTHGVPADIWAEWLEANKDSDMVRAGLIFAHEKAAYAGDKAKDQTSIRTGLEPIDPATPGKHVRGVKAGDARAAA